MSLKTSITIKDVESMLVCLPAVQKARVVVNDWGAIEEIHILTGLNRNPKQIVRDVQSALKAQWDITLDRRKVSVAQIKTQTIEPFGRLRYVGLEVKTDAKTRSCNVCVTLERHFKGHRAVYTGKTKADDVEISRLNALARATCKAVNLTIKPPYEFFADDVAFIDIGQRKAIAVLVGLITPGGNHEGLVGASLITQETDEACVQATLDALNRRYQVLPRQ